MIKPLSPLVDDIVSAICAAPASNDPFVHLAIDHVFPEDCYQAIVDCMPEWYDYRPMHGRSKDVRADGKSTRVKIDLFPEYLRHLPKPKREVWGTVGRALRSGAVRAAFATRLEAPLQQRFGSRLAPEALYPVPILTRDIPGYKLYPHPDTHWKGITVQLYMPRSNAHAHVGTVFHQRTSSGSLAIAKQVPFACNSGYAFVVDKHTWHSVNEVGTEIVTRDSILLTYFVDLGGLRMARNRGKRIGNFLLQEARYLGGR